MKKLLLALLLSCSLIGCATTQPTQTVNPDQLVMVAQAQSAAIQTLYGVGAILQTTPKVCDALYAAGKISKEQYNEVAVIHNKVLGTFNIAAFALNRAIKQGLDPATVIEYTLALTQFLNDKADLDKIMLELNSQPVGGLI